MRASDTAEGPECPRTSPVLGFLEPQQTRTSRRSCAGSSKEFVGRLCSSTHQQLRDDETVSSASVLFLSEFWQFYEGTRKKKFFFIQELRHFSSFQERFLSDFFFFKGHFGLKKENTC